MLCLEGGGIMKPKALGLAAAVLCTIGMGGEPLDAPLIGRIRTEALERSRVLETLHQLLDVHSPRLTASPTYRAAAEWAKGQLGAWGLAGARLEAWDFGHPGWANERCSAHAEAPWKGHLGVEVVSWTPSTPGPVRGQAFILSLPESPTEGELQAVLEAARGRLKGKVVLVAGAKEPPVLNPNPMPARHSEEALAKRFDPAGGAAARGGWPTPARREGALEPKVVDARVDAFLVEAQALVRVNDSGMRNGMIRAFQNRTYDLARAVPTVVMRHEDFGRVQRLARDGREVLLAFDILNRTYPRSTQGLNVLAEIPGSERPQEVVLLGAHLDSWHTATGATDNGASAAVMMEAMRVLQAAGARPRRTIRIALWDGEEHGLLGSEAYVKAHYGSAETPGKEYGQLVAAFNMDSGAGQLRGLSAFGTPATAQVLRELLAPFQDLGVRGAAANPTRPVRRGGPSTDVVSFTSAGLPGISVVQDGLEYFDYTWHTNIDTLERVPLQDAQRSAAVLASVAYHLAQREERLPFFTRETLPAPARPEEAPAAPETKKGN
jgi:hypothetical protein